MHQCRYVNPLNMVEVRSYQMRMKRGEIGVLWARDIILPAKATCNQIQSAG